MRKHVQQLTHMKFKSRFILLLKYCSDVKATEVTLAKNMSTASFLVATAAY